MCRCALCRCIGGSCQHARFFFACYRPYGWRAHTHTHTHTHAHVARTHARTHTHTHLQGLNIIKAKSDEQKWNIDLGGLARIWKVSTLCTGCCCVCDCACLCMCVCRCAGVAQVRHNLPPAGWLHHWCGVLCITTSSTHACRLSSHARTHTHTHTRTHTHVRVQGGCIIRAVFLDEIRKAYERNPALRCVCVYVCTHALVRACWWWWWW